MTKDIFYINCGTFTKLGIRPKEGIEYILNKKAMTITPVDVRTLQVLKKLVVIPS